MQASEPHGGPFTRGTYRFGRSRHSKSDFILALFVELSLEIRSPRSYQDPLSALLNVVRSIEDSTDLRTIMFIVIGC